MSLGIIKGALPLLTCSNAFQTELYIIMYYAFTKIVSHAPYFNSKYNLFSLVTNKVTSLSFCKYKYVKLKGFPNNNPAFFLMHFKQYIYYTSFVQ